MPTYHYLSWTEEEDNKLLEILRSCKERRIKKHEALEEASSALGRTVTSCHNRFYKLLKEQKAVS